MVKYTSKNYSYKSCTGKKKQNKKNGTAMKRKYKIKIANKQNKTLLRKTGRNYDNDEEKIEDQKSSIKRQTTSHNVPKNKHKSTVKFNNQKQVLSPTNKLEIESLSDTNLEDDEFINLT